MIRVLVSSINKTFPTMAIKWAMPMEILHELNIINGNKFVNPYSQSYYVKRILMILIFFSCILKLNTEVWLLHTCLSIIAGK